MTDKNGSTKRYTLTEEEAAAVKRVLRDDRAKIVLESLFRAYAPVDVPYDNLTVHGNVDQKTGNVDWYAEHGIPVSEFLPQTGDVVEYDGRLWTVDGLTHYVRLLPYSGRMPESLNPLAWQEADKSREASCNCPGCDHKAVTRYKVSGSSLSEVGPVEIDPATLEPET